MQVFCTFSLAIVLLAITACHFSTSKRQKVVRTRRFFDILTSKCASRYSAVQFFSHLNFKSGPNMQCLYLKMCFSLQRHAIFPHRNFKNWYFVHFDFKMGFSPQRRTFFFHFSAQPPPPLYRNYFSIQPTHKLKKTQHLAIFLTFRACKSSFD